MTQGISEQELRTARCAALRPLCAPWRAFSGARPWPACPRRPRMRGCARITVALRCALAPLARCGGGTGAARGVAAKTNDLSKTNNVNLSNWHWYGSPQSLCQSPYHSGSQSGSQLETGRGWGGQPCCSDPFRSPPTRARLQPVTGVKADAGDLGGLGLLGVDDPQPLSLLSPLPLPPPGRATRRHRWSLRCPRAACARSSCATFERAQESDTRVPPRRVRLAHGWLRRTAEEKVGPSLNTTAAPNG